MVTEPNTRENAMGRLIRAVLALTISVVTGTSLAYAQAPRTWVSGVGDDANPCSRTAPCKTFAGAISKTAAGGEISVLDPGGYGGVTITKSLTLSGDGTLASVLVAGTNAITINTTAPPPLPVVTLRNLSIIGLGTGINGINMFNGASLVVDRVTISGFATAAISVSTGKAVVVNSTITQNPGIGVRGIGGVVSVEDSILSLNGVAVQSDPSGKVRLSNNGIYNNVTDFVCLGGILASAGNNRNAGNGSGCVPNQVINLQ